MLALDLQNNENIHTDRHFFVKLRFFDSGDLKTYITKRQNKNIRLNQRLLIQVSTCIYQCVFTCIDGLWLNCLYTDSWAWSLFRRERSAFHLWVCLSDDYSHTLYRLSWNLEPTYLVKRWSDVYVRIFLFPTRSKLSIVLRVFSNLRSIGLIDFQIISIFG